MTTDSPRSSSSKPRLALHWQVLMGLAFGVGYAWASIQLGWNQFTLNYIQPLGDIFINILKLIAVPLVLFSIIGGVASLGDIKKLGRLGAKTLGLYLLTTFFAVTLGLVLVNVFQPGTGASEDLKTNNRIRYELWRDAHGIEALDDIHLIQDPSLAGRVAEIQGKQEGMNAWVADKLSKAENASKSGPLQPLVDVVPKNIFQSLSDMAMLQIIFFAVFFGVVLVKLEEPKRGSLIRAIDGLNDVFVGMVWMVMKAMPVFVFALMAGQIVKAAGTDPEKFQELL
ncbi:MAG: hypothetical protein RLZZ314_751, partial [Bacteroidota bacterium]